MKYLSHKIPSITHVCIVIAIFNMAYSTGKQRSIHQYQYFPESDRVKLREDARKMFYFGYDNYMKYAFPKDELNPIYCTGRGPDYQNPSNINVNDALGDYSLTLIDCLDTLAIIGNTTEFKNAVKLVLRNVSFDKDNVVQVFEATIRVLGGLIAAHLFIVDPNQPLGNLKPTDYDDDLLNLAHDLISRLLPAFSHTKTGVPWPRVNLKYGIPSDCSELTCTAGVGTLLLEFGILGKLTGDPKFEHVAREALDSLWKYRSNSTGLFGNVFNINSGEWFGKMSGVGAGVDSFYEYLLKSYIVFGKRDDLRKFNSVYASIKKHMRIGELCWGKAMVAYTMPQQRKKEESERLRGERDQIKFINYGMLKSLCKILNTLLWTRSTRLFDVFPWREFCNNGTGGVPLYVNVDMDNGQILNTWIDSLQASFSGVQVLRGDIEEAICSHAIYYAIWQRYGALPERFNWQLKAPEVMFYPLRPEFVESTYLLYQATKHPFYLHVGSDILASLEAHTKAECGYATIHDVLDRTLEDRMESFFLSETCKYLFLLFDTENPVNKDASNYIFSTEGHIFKLDNLYRGSSNGLKNKKPREWRAVESVTISDAYNISQCSTVEDMRFNPFPLKEVYWTQIEEFVGLR